MIYRAKKVSLLFAFSLVLSACGGSGGDSTGNPDGGEPPVIELDDDTPPSIALFNATPSNVVVGDAVTYRWSVTDAGNSELNCTLDIDSDGAAEYNIAGCDTTQVQGHVFESAGSYESTLTVTNSSSLEDSETLTIEVEELPDSAPTIASFESDLTEAEINSAVVFSWIIEDPTGEGVDCSLDIDDDGQTEYDIEDCLSTTSQSHIYSIADEYTARIRTTNSQGESVTSTTTLSVGAPEVPVGTNLPPVVSALTAGLNNLMIGEATVITFTVEDADSGDVLICSLDADGDGIEDHSLTDCSGDQAITHIYDQSGDVEAVLTVTDSVGATVNSSVPVVVVPLKFRIAAPEPAIAGEQVLLEIGISNVSSVPVNNIQVLYRVPNGVEFHDSRDAEPDTGCGLCMDGDEAVWNIPALPAGESRTIHINASILPNVLGGSSIDSVVSIRADEMAEDVARSRVIKVNNRPLSQVAISASHDPVVVGNSVTLRLDIGNISAMPLGNWELRADLSNRVVVNSISDGGSIDPATGDIVWTADGVDVLSTIRREFNITIPADTTLAEVLVARAILQHEGGEEQDAVAEQILTVVDTPSPLLVDWAAFAEPAVAGERIRYDITISNVGLIPLNNVNAVLRVPSELTFHDSRDVEPDTNCGLCEDGNEARWQFSSLAAGESRNIQIDATVNTDVQGGSLITKNLRLDADGMVDSISRTKTVSVNNRPLSMAALTASKDPAIAGETLTLQLDVGNIHSTSLTNLTMRAVLPSNIIVNSASDGGQVSATGSEIVWNVEQLPALQTLRREVNVSVSTDVRPGSSVSSRFELTHSDGTETDATAEYATTVSEVSSPLTLEISPASNSAVAGARLGYQLKIRNVGLIPVSNVRVMYRVPTELEFHDSRDVEPDTNCGLCQVGDEAFWTFATIQPGELKTIDINAFVLANIQAGALIVSPINVEATGLVDSINQVNVVSVN